MIDSALGKNDQMKRLAEKGRLQMVGQKERRKAEHELTRLEQDKPIYQITNELKK